MADLNFMPRILAVLHSLPLWIFIALAGSGYAVLFVPSFGGADIAGLRREWGGWFWADAVTFTVFAFVCAGDLVIKERRSRARRWRRWARSSYFNVYAPLFSDLVKIHITTASLSLRLRDRLNMALFKLNARKSWKRGIKAAWKELFDRNRQKRSGEVDFGSSFPIERMREQIHRNLVYCDDKLIDLMTGAWNSRIEHGVPDNELTEKDIQLYDHVMKGHEWLKRRVAA